MQTEIILKECFTRGTFCYFVICDDLNFVCGVENLEESGREIVDLIQQYPDRQFTVRMVKE